MVIKQYHSCELHTTFHPILYYQCQIHREMQLFGITSVGISYIIQVWHYICIHHLLEEVRVEWGDTSAGPTRGDS
jgi:hypothetical protein